MNFPDEIYDLTEFFTKPTDDKGHGSKVNARIPPDLARVVDIIVSSKRFPLLTQSDFFRDAIWRLCGLLYSHVDDFESNTIMAKLRVAEETIRAAEAGEKLQKVIDDLGMRIVAFDSQVEVEKLVRRVFDDLSIVKETYWRERCKRTMRERYGQYLDDDRKATE